jgi:hypothetical protein
MVRAATAVTSVGSSETVLTESLQEKDGKSREVDQGEVRVISLFFTRYPVSRDGQKDTE